jgi:ribose transport system substrate-binding protein
MLFGCASPTPAPQQAEPEQPAAEAPAAEAPAAPLKKQVYYEVNALINLPYFIDHRLGLEFAGYALGKEVKYVGPVDYDMTLMINTFEQAIAEKPAGINVVGFDPALKPSIDKAIEAGIPVMTLDAEVYGSKRYTFLGTGNYNAGRVGAQHPGGSHWQQR